MRVRRWAAAGAVATAAAGAAAVVLLRRRARAQAPQGARGKALGKRLKAVAASVFERAEARGAFKKLPAFQEDFHADYPELAVLEQNHAVIREECLALLADRARIPDLGSLVGKYTAGGVHAVAWKSFMFKSGGFIEENCRQAPRTAALLRTLPGVHTAFFSILEPHQHIQPHWGYWKGFVRYHLGVVVPDDNRDGLCWIRINPAAQDRSRRDEIAAGEFYRWREGRAVMFDDTFLHEAANESDAVRVVLFLDVVRRMPPGLRLLNRVVLALANADSSVRNVRRRARVPATVAA